MMEAIRDLYWVIKKNVIQQGFSNEIFWQENVLNTDFTEKAFYREMAWVVLNTGFKEEIIRRCFGKIEFAFFDWDQSLIFENEALCVQKALSVFNSRSKINSILENIRKVQLEGFDNFKNRLLKDPLVTASELKFIGEVTAFHLIKNLGIDIAKPDRHLIRIAEQLGVNDVQFLCEHISEETGDPISVVDIVLWRFAAINPNYSTKIDSILDQYTLV